MKNLLKKRNVHSLLWQVRGKYGFSNVKVKFIKKSIKHKNEIVFKEIISVNYFDNETILFDIIYNNHAITQNKVELLKNKTLTNDILVSKETLENLKVVKERVNYFNGCEYLIEEININESNNKLKERENNFNEKYAHGMCCQCGKGNFEWYQEECDCGGGIIEVSSEYDAYWLLNDNSVQ